MYSHAVKITSIDRLDSSSGNVHVLICVYLCMTGIYLCVFRYQVCINASPKLAKNGRFLLNSKLPKMANEHSSI